MERDGLVVVAGGGGFIGGHLIADLLRQGFTRIRSVGIKPFDEWYQRFPEVDNRRFDLREKPAAYESLEGAAAVYDLAADMGGMGFIELNKALCMLSVQINTNLLLAARDSGVERYFFSSSACVYPADKQTSTEVVPLKESDAYPAMPQDGYGWEKLFSERMCRHFREDFGLITRIARYSTGMGRTGPGTVAARRRPPRSAGRSPARSSTGISRSRSGVTASRREASCTSTTACTAPSYS